MKRILLYIVLFFTLVSFSQSSRRASNFIKNTTEQVVPGEVYSTTFNDLTGWVLDQTAGTVGLSAPIGTEVPNVTNALTFTHTTTGQCNASYDLGTDYTELYIQYYATVVNQSTATNYANNLEVGSAIAANETAQFFMRHNLAGNAFTVVGEGNGFAFTDRITAEGAWLKLGIHVTGTTANYYINRVLKATGPATVQAMRYITAGGTGGGTSSYKLQIAALTVNTLGFQDIITNSNGVGEYVGHYVDHTMETNTDYNGVDLSSLDKSGWTGLHSAPYANDPSNPTVYTDGPASFMTDVGTNNLGKLIYADKFGDQFFYRQGVTHYVRSLSLGHAVSFTGAPPTIDDHPKVSSYGSGSNPVVKNAIRVTSGWTLHDAANNIWKQAFATVGNCNGAWDNAEPKALREAYSVANMANYVGVWYEDGTDLYVRLWDEADPNSKTMSVSTNQPATFVDFTEISNIDWENGQVISADGMIVEFCSFELGSGVSVTDATVRDCQFIDNWAGVDYGNTIANNASTGLGGAGNGGIGINEGALFYRNIVDSNYLGITIDSDAHDAVVSYNLFKNSISNTIQIAGTGDGDPLRPIIISNNTVFGGGRHINNDPYPIVRPQPHHSFVHQNGGYGNFWFFNNLMLLHYNENSGFSLQDGNSSDNIMSFVTLAYENAEGRLGYNKYFITPISNTPAVIFNGGASNNISTWRTNMALEAFTDIDGSSDPDTTSTVETTLPVTAADYTAVSGKWLTTNPIPITTGGGYNFDYSTLGIFTDLAGNPITSTKNIGAY